VFGSNRRKKVTFDSDESIQSLADAYSKFLRNETSSHVPSDHQPDLFESPMRRWIKLIA
jgi:hypothetical protein